MKPYPLKYCIKGGNKEDDGGAFKIFFKGRELYVIASHGGGWEHVSVSLKNRTPNWDEMCFIKDLFFKEDEIVVQYHPKKENYVNLHKYTLHLWRPINKEIDIPPIQLV